VALQQRVGGTWRQVASMAAARDGSLNVPVKPRVTTQYRLAAGKVAAPPARVLVAPFVRLLPPRTQTELHGSIRPALGGASVAIQRQEGTSWTTVARATTDSAGVFAAQLQLSAGTYRARVAPGHGLVTGLSAVLLVSVS
jgi:hypothetical protein